MDGELLLRPPECYLAAVRVRRVEGASLASTPVSGSAHRVVGWDVECRCSEHCSWCRNAVEARDLPSSGVRRRKCCLVDEIAKGNTRRIANCRKRFFCLDVTSKYVPRRPRMHVWNVIVKKDVMWMPAVLPRLLSNGYRVTLVWFGACPAAQVDVYLPTYEYPATCNAVRTAEISSIINVHPSLVLLAERDHLVPSGPGTFYTPTTWTSALETTIRTLKGAGSKVGVIEDGPSFPWSVPTCLSQSPSMAKACGVQVGSGQASDMHAAEAGAAAHAGAFFIPTHQWLCATSCSAVIQSMVVYTDNDHLTKSYAGYLSGVMGSALGTFIH